MCSYTPRFSYSGPETTVRAVCTWCVPGGLDEGTGWVWGTGWVYRVGNTGLYQVPTRTARGSPYPAKRAPEGPAGPWSGWGRGWTRVPGCSAAGRPYGPPYGPGRSPWALPVHMPSECRLWANMARFHSFLRKVSQNAEVSPKSVHKAYVSPCFQNGLRKSPLEILRFLISAAFSHKELMGRFDPWSEVHGQNDEVSPVCTHPCMPRRGRNTPSTSAASCSWRSIPHCSARSHPDGILNEVTFNRFTGDYD